MWQFQILSRGSSIHVEEDLKFSLLAQGCLLHQFHIVFSCIKHHHTECARWSIKSRRFTLANVYLQNDAQYKLTTFLLKSRSMLQETQIKQLTYIWNSICYIVFLDCFCYRVDLVCKCFQCWSSIFSVIFYSKILHKIACKIMLWLTSTNIEWWK